MYSTSENGIDIVELAQKKTKLKPPKLADIIWIHALWENEGTKVNSTIKDSKSYENAWTLTATIGLPRF